MEPASWQLCALCVGLPMLAENLHVGAYEQHMTRSDLFRKLAGPGPLLAASELPGELRLALEANVPSVGLGFRTQV